MLRASLTAAGSANPITSAKAHPAIRTLRVCTVGAVLACIVSGASQPAMAQPASVQGAADLPAFAPGMIAHMQAMRRFKDPDQGVQQAPPVIPRFEIDRDPSGAVATFQPGGATFTFNNAFFQNLGANGRTCFSCHQPQSGWTVSAASVAARFAQSGGTDPIFRLVDGATCPSADVSTPAAKRQAYTLLIDKGLIRIGLPMPDPSILQFEVTAVVDPYGCNTNPVTGLDKPDEPHLLDLPAPAALHQSRVPDRVHVGRPRAQPRRARPRTQRSGTRRRPLPPTAAQIADIVAFETGLFTAQEIDARAGTSARRRRDGRSGRAVAAVISSSASTIRSAITRPVPRSTRTSSTCTGRGSAHAVRRRREPRACRSRAARRCSTRRRSTSPGSAGLNDALNQPSIAGFCGTCHDTPNVGNHSVKAPLEHRHRRCGRSRRRRCSTSPGCRCSR